MFYENKQTPLMFENTLRQYTLRTLLPQMRVCQGAEPLLKLASLSPTHKHIRMGKRLGLFVDTFDPTTKVGDFSILGILLRKVVQIPQQMHPTGLMQSLVPMIPTVEIADQNSVKPASQSLLDHFFTAPLMAGKEPQRRGGETPDIPILPILAPTGLIGMHQRAFLQLLEEFFVSGFAFLGDPMQQIGRAH